MTKSQQTVGLHPAGINDCAGALDSSNRDRHRKRIAQNISIPEKLHTKLGFLRARGKFYHREELQCLCKFRSRIPRQLASTSQAQQAAVRDSRWTAKLSHCGMLILVKLYCTLYAKLFPFVSLPTGKQTLPAHRSAKTESRKDKKIFA